MASTRRPARREVQRQRRVIQKHLDAGAPPYGVPTGNYRRGALALAMADLGKPKTTVNDWWKPGGLVERTYPDLAFDWPALAAAFRAAELAAALDHETWEGREPPAEIIVEPGRRVRRFIVSWAQDGTPPHAAFWANLRAFARHHGAKLMLGAGTYQHGAVYTDRRNKPGAYHPDLAPFITADPHEVAGLVLIAADINTLATAERPLSGLQTYPAGRWGVYPHPKIAFESVPRTIGTPPRFVMTTGAVTLRNYVGGKKMAAKAAFHHVLGALLIEIDLDGAVFCRHLLAEETTGAFFDLDLRVDGGRISKGHRAAALTVEPHFDVIDREVLAGVWGLTPALDPIEGASLIDQVRPHEQHWHDVLHFGRRSHHHIRDEHKRAELHFAGTASVEAELRETARFIEAARRPGTLTVIIPSNHHDHFRRWLLEGRPAIDHVNAAYFHECNAALYRKLEDGARLHAIDMFEVEARRLAHNGLPGVEFIGRQASHIICPEAGGGIECGHHGDRGADGAYGSIGNLRRLGSKANIGHSHRPGILDGVYQTGVCARLDLDWLQGPSSWAHAHIITYINGKRAIVAMVGSKWRAGL